MWCEILVSSLTIDTGTKAAELETCNNIDITCLECHMIVLRFFTME